MKMKTFTIVVLGLLNGAVALGQFAATGTTTLSLTVAVAASIRVDTATTSLTTSGGIFANPYTGTTNFTFKIRTGKTSGTGSITLQVTSDFSPSGGPSVLGGDLLTYTCTVASGTACVGSTTSSTTATTSVATFGADAHSASAGDSGSTAWSLTNDTRYQTGAYSATVTYTISAT